MEYLFKYGFIIFWGGACQFIWAQKPELVVQLGHTTPIHSVTFSPNGQFILTSSGDFDSGTAILWDLNGRELQRFRGHNQGIRSVAFSPNGHYVLTGSWDGTAKLWDLNGRELQVFKGHELDVLSVAFSPDGQYLLTSSLDNTGKLWSLEGKLLQNFIGHSSYVNSITFSPDGQYILTGSRDNTAKLWNLQGKELQNFNGHGLEILSVSFSPDGRLILTGSQDKTAKLWNLQGQELRSIKGHTDWVSSAIFSSDGQHILTGSLDRTARLWDLQGQELRIFKGHSSEIWSVAFSADSKWVLTGSHDNTARLWDLAGRVLQNFSGYSNAITSVAFSPNGRYILTGSKDSTAQLWGLTKYERLCLRGHDHIISSVAFASNGHHILTGSYDLTARLWDINGKELHIYKHSSGIEFVGFSPGRQNILTSSRNQTAKLWDINGRELQNFSSGFSIAFSQDGKCILTGIRDDYLSGKAILWDRNGQELHDFKGHRNLVSSVAFSPDGQHILTGSWDETVKLWNLDGRELQSFRAHSNAVSSVAFSPDGQSILTGSWDETAKIWDLSGRELRRFEGHTSEVWGATFSPGGNYVLTGSRDHTAKLWDAKTGENLLTFIGLSGKNDSWIIVSENGYYMGSKMADKHIHFKIGFQFFSFDQFDLRLNRPDKVLETLSPFSADSSFIRLYRQAYYKRLEKYSFTEDMLSDDYHVPECTIRNSNQILLSTSNSSLQINIQARDTIRPLDRLNVFVNDVPIYGIVGIDLRNKNIKEYDTTLNISLSRGENKIQVSALNQGGAESLRATAYITNNGPEVKPHLYLITIGVSDYEAKGKALQYAAKDAQDIAGFYSTSTGFSQIHTRILTDGLVSKENILALRDFLEQSQVDDQVLIYVSGHGLLDENYDFYYATHDIDFGNPAGKGILYDDIEGLLDGIPARKKLLLMDACHSGEYDADATPLTQAQKDSLKAKSISYKGFSKGDNEGAPVLGLQNSFEMMQQLFADLRRGSGATVISSSSGMQFSYEETEWQNGAFTYVFLRGLKTMEADANNDGQVTASEIQAYVAEFVPRLTEGLQVPTFRRENLEYDFRVW